MTAAGYADHLEGKTGRSRSTLGGTTSTVASGPGHRAIGPTCRATFSALRSVGAGGRVLSGDAVAMACRGAVCAPARARDNTRGRVRGGSAAPDPAECSARSQPRGDANESRVQRRGDARRAAAVLARAPRHLIAPGAARRGNAARCRRGRGHPRRPVVRFARLPARSLVRATATRPVAAGRSTAADPPASESRPQGPRAGLAPRSIGRMRGGDLRDRRRLVACADPAGRRFFPHTRSHQLLWQRRS